MSSSETLSLNVNKLSLQVTMLASGVLWFKYQITSIIQARAGFSVGKRAPED